VVSTEPNKTAGDPAQGIEKKAGKQPPKESRANSAKTACKGKESEEGLSEQDGLRLGTVQ
jgi:hypothetical protein